MVREENHFWLGPQLLRDNQPCFRAVLLREGAKNSHRIQSSLSSVPLWHIRSSKECKKKHNRFPAVFTISGNTSFSLDATKFLKFLCSEEKQAQERFPTAHPGVSWNELSSRVDEPFAEPWDTHIITQESSPAFRRMKCACSLFVPHLEVHFSHKAVAGAVELRR